MEQEDSLDVHNTSADTSLNKLPPGHAEHLLSLDNSSNTDGVWKQEYAQRLLEAAMFTQDFAVRRKLYQTALRYESQAKRESKKQKSCSRDVITKVNPLSFRPQEEIPPPKDDKDMVIVVKTNRRKRSSKKKRKKKEPVTFVLDLTDDEEFQKETKPKPNYVELKDMLSVPKEACCMTAPSGACTPLYPIHEATPKKEEEADSFLEGYKLVSEDDFTHSTKCGGDFIHNKQEPDTIVLDLTEKESPENKLVPPTWCAQLLDDLTFAGICFSCLLRPPSETDSMFATHDDDASSTSNSYSCGSWTCGGSYSIPHEHSNTSNSDLEKEKRQGSLDELPLQQEDSDKKISQQETTQENQENAPQEETNAPVVETQKVGQEEVQEKPPGSPRKVPSKKMVWKQIQDVSSGKFYYYHKVTRETTWTKPPPFETNHVVPTASKDAVSSTPKQELVSDKNPNDIKDMDTKTAAVETQESNPDLVHHKSSSGLPQDLVEKDTTCPKPTKPLWKCHKSQGRVYYYNRLTRETTWTKPRDFEEQQDAYKVAIVLYRRQEEEQAEQQAEQNAKETHPTVTPHDQDKEQEEDAPPVRLFIKRGNRVEMIRIDSLTPLDLLEEASLGNDTTVTDLMEDLPKGNLVAAPVQPQQQEEEIPPKDNVIPQEEEEHEENGQEAILVNESNHNSESMVSKKKKKRFGPNFISKSFRKLKGNHKKDITVGTHNVVLLNVEGIPTATTASPTKSVVVLADGQETEEESSFDESCSSCTPATEGLEAVIVETGSSL